MNKPLEGITLNDEPLRDIIVRDEVQKDFYEVSKCRTFYKPITKHNFYKKVKLEKGRCIKVEARQPTKLIEILNEIQRNPISAEVEISSKALGKTFKCSSNAARVYLNFLVHEGLFSMRSNGSTKIYSQEKHIDSISSVLKKWSEYDKPWAHKRKPRREKVKQFDENLAILVHAKCRFTKAPWHAERQEVKDQFIKLAEMNISIDVLNILFDIIDKIKETMDIVIR